MKTALTRELEHLQSFCANCKRCSDLWTNEIEILGYSHCFSCQPMIG